MKPDRSKVLIRVATLFEPDDEGGTLVKRISSTAV
jgi:hypothetical protein